MVRFSLWPAVIFRANDLFTLIALFAFHSQNFFLFIIVSLTLFLILCAELCGELMLPVGWMRAHTHTIWTHRNTIRTEFQPTELLADSVNPKFTSLLNHNKYAISLSLVFFFCFIKFSLVLIQRRKKMPRFLDYYCHLLITLESFVQFLSNITWSLKKINNSNRTFVFSFITFRPWQEFAILNNTHDSEHFAFLNCQLR